jgi:hypothetical protein
MIRMSMRMQIVLSEVLEQFDRREVVIKFDNPSFVSDTPNRVLIEERPAGAPYTQRRIVRAAEYSQWARCSACGGHFSPLRRTRSHKMSAITYYACDGCVDTAERVMMGGRSSS